MRNTAKAEMFARVFGLAAVALVLLLVGAAAGGAPPLATEATIALPSTSGRIDHLSIDLARKHLFVAELGNGTVDVVDIAGNRVIHRWMGLREPQGVVYAPAADRIAVASAGDGTVRLFDADTFVARGVIELGDDADNARLGPDGRDILVGYGKGGLAVIDPAGGVVRRKIKLAAHPEGFQVAPDGIVYVNVPDAGGIAVVDLNSGKTVATWKFPGLSGNFPIALGEAGVVAVVFRGPARFVRIDRASGHEISRTNVCGDADDVFFDARRQQYYISCGAGNVDTIAVTGGTVHPLAAVVTSGGARTSLFVPDLDRLFVAGRAGLLGSDASIRVLRPAP